MLGALLAVLSAISFAFSNVVMRRGVMVSSPSFGLYVTVILGVPLFVIAAAIAGQLTDFSALSGEAVFLLVVAGIIHFLIGRYCNFRAVNAIGVNRTQPIQMTNIFYSILVAMIVLDERLSLITDRAAHLRPARWGGRPFQAKECRTNIVYGCPGLCCYRCGRRTW